MANNEPLAKEDFKKKLKKGLTFWLRTEQAFESEDMHIFVVLNDGADGDPLIMVNGTSQITKAKRRMEKRCQDVAKTSVEFSKGSYGFLSKDTIFDCNSVHEVNAYKINFGINTGMISAGFSDGDVEKLINAVINSDNISERIKRIIRRK